MTVSAAGRGYTVDIVKMEQKNDETGVVRKIRRLSQTGPGQFIFAIFHVCVYVTLCVYISYDCR